MGKESKMQCKCYTSYSLHEDRINYFQLTFQNQLVIHIRAGVEKVIFVLFFSLKKQKSPDFGFLVFKK